jgi:hypothetical protein
MSAGCSLYDAALGQRNYPTPALHTCSQRFNFKTRYKYMYKGNVCKGYKVSPSKRIHGEIRAVWPATVGLQVQHSPTELWKGCVPVTRKYTQQTSRNDPGKESSNCTTFNGRKRVGSPSLYFHSIFSLFYQTSTWSNVVLINRVSYR